MNRKKEEKEEDQRKKKEQMDEAEREKNDRLEFLEAYYKIREYINNYE